MIQKKLSFFVRVLIALLAIAFGRSVINNASLIQSPVASTHQQQRAKNGTATDWSSWTTNTSLTDYWSDTVLWNASSSSWNDWTDTLTDTTTTMFGGAWSSSSTPTTNNEKVVSIATEADSGRDSSLPLGHPNNPVSLVIQLSGEMGNQLGKLAYGYGLKWILEEDYNTSSKVIFRHQVPSKKWIRAEKSLKSCFPKFRGIDFAKGNTKEFEVRQKETKEWLGDKYHSFARCGAEACIREGLENFVRNLSNTTHPPPEIPVNANITQPFLYADTITLLSYVTDRFYDRWIDLFEFDLNNPNCCDSTRRAQPNETVLHARGYKTEMPGAVKRMGFEELSPNKMANELLSNHQRGDKVAVLSRYAKFGQEYVDSMLAVGLDARFVETRNGELSFCFLMSGQDEIVAYSSSSFGIWAAYLGNASKARIYSLKSPERIKRRGDGYFVRYNFTNPTLKEKISFELYNSEVQDQIEQSSSNSEKQPKSREADSGGDSSLPLGHPNNPVSLVIQLSGELGNQLGKLAYGYGLKWILEEDYNTSSKVIMRHQVPSKKWIRAWASMESCFPKFRGFDPAGGNTKEFEVRQKETKEWLGDKYHSFARCGAEACIREGLQKFVRNLSNTTHPPPEMPVNAKITQPFLYADTITLLSYITDRFYDRLIDLFEFDLNNPNCCDSTRAQPNETVLHTRGFTAEMPKAGIKMGFEELSPNKTANELLSNHQRGDKIVVLGRFAKFGQEYVDSMLAVGLDARFVETRNGELSFCFLMSGQDETVAYSSSSFGIWAAYLGNASKARLYSLKSPARIKRRGDNYFARYNFTNPTLKEKISFELYNSEAQDRVEKK
jgi:hypothetical protein